MGVATEETSIHHLCLVLASLSQKPTRHREKQKLEAQNEFILHTTKQEINKLNMADTAVVDTTTTVQEIKEKVQEAKEKKDVETEETKETEAKENGSGDTPAENGTATNGADHTDKANGEKEEEKNGTSEVAEEAAEEKKEAGDNVPVKRAAEEEIIETKKQKVESENGDSKAEVEA